MRQLVHKLSKLNFLKKANRSSLFLLLVFVLIFLQFLVFNPTDLNSDPTELKTAEQIQKLASLQKNKKTVEQKMSGIHLVENFNRMKGWELFAEEATGSADAQWVLKKVKIEFFAEDQSSYTVVGDVGEIDGSTKNILIRGEVITTSTNGYQFKTNDLRFEANSKTLKSDDSVEMTGPADQSGSGFLLTGIGFTIDLIKNKMIIRSSVQANKVIENKTFDISSNQAWFSNKNQEGQFLGDVHLKYDKTLIQAPEALFKYSSEQKKLKTILLKDKVTLRELDRRGFCNELEMDLELDQITLRGSPKVQMQDDEISGEEIVFTEGGQKVRINNVKVTGQLKN